MNAHCYRITENNFTTLKILCPPAYSSPSPNSVFCAFYFTVVYDDGFVGLLTPAVLTVELHANKPTSAVSVPDFFSAAYPAQERSASWTCGERSGEHKGGDIREVVTDAGRLYCPNSCAHQ